jgi:hypothetical protein
VPNPLLDELSDEAKAWLAVLFAEMKRHYHSAPHVSGGMTVRLIRQRNPWDRL